MHQKLKSVLWIGSCVALIALAAWGIHALRKGQSHGFYIVGKAPAFCLTDQHGQHICNKDFEGKIWVVDFFFTSCPTICPVMTSHMVAVQDAFADHSIQEKGVRSPHWHLLTGDEKEIYRIANEGFNIYAKAGDTPENFEHSGLFALVDTQGNIICRKEKGKPILFYNGMTPEGIAMLIEDIKKLKQ